MTSSLLGYLQSLVPQKPQGWNGCHSSFIAYPRWPGDCAHDEVSCAVATSWDLLLCELNARTEFTACEPHVFWYLSSGIDTRPFAAFHPLSYRMLNSRFPQPDIYLYSDYHPGPASPGSRLAALQENLLRGGDAILYRDEHFTVQAVAIVGLVDSELMLRGAQLSRKYRRQIEREHGNYPGQPLPLHGAHYYFLKLQLSSSIAGESEAYMLFCPWDNWLLERQLLHSRSIPVTYYCATTDGCGLDDIGRCANRDAYHLTRTARAETNAYWITDHNEHEMERMGWQRCDGVADWGRHGQRHTSHIYEIVRHRELAGGLPIDPDLVTGPAEPAPIPNILNRDTVSVGLVERSGLGLIHYQDDHGLLTGWHQGWHWANECHATSKHVCQGEFRPIPNEMIEALGRETGEKIRGIVSIDDLRRWPLSGDNDVLIDLDEGCVTVGALTSLDTWAFVPLGGNQYATIVAEVMGEPCTLTLEPGLRYSYLVEERFQAHPIADASLSERPLSMLVRTHRLHLRCGDRRVPVVFGDFNVLATFDPALRERLLDEKGNRNNLARGILGWSFFRRFAVLLSPRRGRCYLRPLAGEQPTTHL